MENYVLPGIQFEKIKRISEKGKDTVYCMKVEKNSNFIANGIIVANCDSLRYAIASAFPQGELNNPDEQMTISQIRKQVYGNEEPQSFWMS